MRSWRPSPPSRRPSGWPPSSWADSTQFTSPCVTSGTSGSPSRARGTLDKGDEADDLGRPGLCRCHGRPHAGPSRKRWSAASTIQATRPWCLRSATTCHRHWTASSLTRSSRSSRPSTRSSSLTDEQVAQLDSLHVAVRDEAHRYTTQQHGGKGQPHKMMEPMISQRRAYNDALSYLTKDQRLAADRLYRSPGYKAPAIQASK